MIEWAGIYLLIFMVIAGFVIGYMSRPPPARAIVYYQPFKEPCKHGGGFCMDHEMFDVCPEDDATKKVECWRAGVFKEDPLQGGDIQVDLGGPPEEGRLS